MKPRLLVLTSTFPRWQNDTDPPFVYELSRRLTDVFEVIIHTPHYPGAKSFEIMDGMRVHRFRYFFAPFEKLAGSTGILPTLRQNKLYYALVPFFLLAQFFSLMIVVRKYRPSKLHSHWLVPQSFFAVMVGMLTNTPVIATAHGADVFGLQGNLFFFLKRFILGRLQAVTVVSRSLHDALVPILPAGISTHIIPMGVDAQLFSPNNKNSALRAKFGIEEHFLLFVGRLTEKKGVHYLIDAMGLVRKKQNNVKLLIVGSGELEHHLKAQTKLLGLNDIIHFIGSVPNHDLPQYFREADIFIGPSIIVEGGDTEGFGLTFVEAAMSGCLVIGSKIGGVVDIIEDGKTGFLVPQQNALALADKIIFSLSLDDNRRHKIQQAARKCCVEKFDWLVVAEKYKKVLLNVC